MKTKRFEQTELLRVKPSARRGRVSPERGAWWFALIRARLTQPHLPDSLDAWLAQPTKGIQ